MRLFLSYASQDRTRVDQLASHLIGLGHDVFWDQDLTAGSGYRAQLEQELSAADHVIVLWTKNSVKSQWVKEEAEAARKAGKLLPIRFRVAPPFGFRELHTPDLPLLSDGATVAQVLNLGSGQPPPPQPPPPEGAANRSPADWYGKRGGLFSWASKPR